MSDIKDGNAAPEAQKTDDEWLDESLEETFPASDPIAIHRPTTPSHPQPTGGGDQA